MKLRVCHYDNNSDILTVVDSDGITCLYNGYEIKNSLYIHITERNDGVSFNVEELFVSRTDLW